MTRAAAVIATLGPVGYWPLGPGTVASALIALLWWAVPIPVWAWLAWVALLIPVGALLAGRAERVLGTDDGRIVIDEVAGMSIAVLAAPHSLAGAGAAFALFRVFDIAKPPPLGRLHRVPGGWGVMLDDLGAGVLAGIGVWIAWRFL